MCSLLQASYCGYIPRLEAWAEQDIAPEIHLFAATERGSAEAAQRLHKLAESQQNLHWIRLLADKGFAEAHYYLAMQTDSPAQKRRHLMAAAEKHHLEALFELGIHDNSPDSKVYFLEQAAQLDYFPAQQALYQWYWFHEDYKSALPWLRKVAQQDGNAALTLALHLWRTGKREMAKRSFKSAQTLGSEEASQYLNLITRYWQKQESHSTPAPQCAMQLQFVATSLDSMKQAHDFYQRFADDTELSTLPICLNTPVWVEQPEFQCQNRASNNYRIECPLFVLDEIFEPDSFTHLTVFTRQGKANVVNGVMYLDLADKYTVFVHELAHFVGFVDEYPLSDEFAHYYCDGQQEFPNLVVLPEGNSVESLNLEYWQGFDADIALSRASTCRNHSAQAYKLSGRMTFMEFHDTGYIPDIYKAIWRERLLSREHVRPAAINIAQSLEEIGNVPAAQKWWQQYNNWR
ncbi:hypothetical protein [Planctobacterium marinum]|uniref:Sel1 repeat family protein n=1 Tax=Planctobacterium marinum TaxID=1631968 RepID=A0AA48KV93_9ALTE|nr:hypothetical protein MACH26_28010 [Planctobacterium marinum]